MNSINLDTIDFGPEWRTNTSIIEGGYRQPDEPGYGGSPTMPDKRLVLGTSIQSESTCNVKDTEDHSTAPRKNWRQTVFGGRLILGGIAIACAAALGAFPPSMAAACCAFLYISIGLVHFYS